MAVPLDAAMPQGLDLGAGFTLRVTALAVSDGSVSSAVKVSNLSVMVGEGSGVTGGSITDLATDGWYLIPGPGTDESVIQGI